MDYEGKTLAIFQWLPAFYGIFCKNGVTRRAVWNHSPMTVSRLNGLMELLCTSDLEFDGFGFRVQGTGAE